MTNPGIEQEGQRSPQEFTMTGRELKELRDKIIKMENIEVKNPLLTGIPQRITLLTANEPDEQVRRRLEAGAGMLRFLFEQQITIPESVYQVTATDDGLPGSKLRFRIDEDPITQG